MLESVLGRAAPPDWPLDASLAGWIFTPVFLEADGGAAIKGWIDFAGGGMAVLEDRFAASSYFEFRALEVSWNVDVLYALRLAIAAGVSTVTMADLVAVVMKASREREQIDGLQDLVISWNFQFQLDRIRLSSGRLWPESFAELEKWIESCTEAPDPAEEGTKREFVLALRELAVRRFPNATPPRALGAFR